MNYSLVLDLQGADKVENSLASLKSAVKNLSSSGGVGTIFSGGSSSPTSIMVSDLSKAKVYSKDIATNLAKVAAIKGLRETGGKDLSKIFGMGELNASGNTIKGLREVTGTNLAKVAAMGALGATAIKGLRETGGKDLSKIFGMGELNASGNTIKGLREVTGTNLAKVAAMGALGATAIKGLRETGGKDLSKIFGMGELNASGNTIKGLREVTGKDLAKVNALGDFNKNTQSSSLIQKLSAIPMFAKYLTVIGATVAALDILKKAIFEVAQQIKAAFQFAHTLYGSSLAQGLSLQFNARRSLTAGVLGVPENDVMRFKQSTYVMERLSDAVARIAAAAPDLAYTDAQFRILKIEILGVASSIADKLAPALVGLALVLDNFVKWLGTFFTKFGALFTGALKGALTGILGSTVTGILTQLGDTLSTLGAAALKQNPFTNPLTLMKQLPASAWEHQGLNLGFAGGDTTNNLLRKSNQYLSTLPQIAHALGAGLARGNQFGFTPLVNNP